jgi:hypothetical protein
VEKEKMRRIAMKKTLFVAMCAVCVLFCGLQLSAEQDSFVITSPPIPWFEYAEGQKDLKLGGSYVSVSGDDISFEGLGVGLFGRYAFNDVVALDAGFNYIYIGGEVGTTNIDLWMWSIPVDVELQLFRTDSFALILFAGVNKTWMTLDVEGVTVDADLFGPQFGAQLAIMFTDFVFTPFFMVQNLSGTATVNGKSYDVPSTTAKVYGFDIVYKPWNLTLSSVIQQATTTDSDRDYNTMIISASYDFRWEREPQAGQVEPEPAQPPQPKKGRARR